jgi:hypothetical protein
MERRQKERKEKTKKRESEASRECWRHVKKKKRKRKKHPCCAHGTSMGMSVIVMAVLLLSNTQVLLFKFNNSGENWRGEPERAKDWV